MGKDQDYINYLINRITKDDSLAFTKFYDIYYAKIFRFSRYFSNSDEICREIVADVFYNLWSNRKNLCKLTNLDGYLYTSLRNQSLKYKKREKLMKYDQLEDIPADYYIDVESPELLMIGDEFKELIEKSINELPPRCKTIFLLIREEGIKYREVAEILSVSERTIQAQMAIAVKKIFDTIGKIIKT